MDARKEKMFLRRQNVQRIALRNDNETGSKLERLCWRVARWSPFGGMAVPPSGRDLYLLRTYLTREGQRLHLPSSLVTDADYDVGKGMRPYLHFFKRGDEDQEVHNHPWRVCFSLILTGGYKEYRWNPEMKRLDERVFLPGSINLLRRKDYHRVELLDPKQGCWTLFLSIDRLAKSDGTDWGFLNVTTGKYTPWGEFVSRKGQTDGGSTGN
jgi:hypothetical protein